METGSSGSEQQPMASFCQQNEPLHSVPGSEILDYLSVLRASEGLCRIKLVRITGKTLKSAANVPPPPVLTRRPGYTEVS